MKIKYLAVVIPLITLSGCAVSDKYSESRVSKIESSVLQKNSEKLTAPTWFSSYDDSSLIELVKLGLQNNASLAIAIQNLNIANAELKITQAQQYPLAFGQLSSNSRTTNGSLQSTSNTANLNFEWELDLFGKLAKQSQAASFVKNAAELNVRDLEVLLSASIAEAYFNLRLNEQLLNVVEQELNAADKIVASTQIRKESGFISEGQAIQSQQLLVQLLSKKERIELSRQTAKNRIKLLTASSTEVLENILKKGDIPDFNYEQLRNTPLEIIFYRSDVLAKKEILKATAVSYDATIAQKLPAPTLNGVLNLALNSEPISKTISVALSTAFPIFSKAIFPLEQKAKFELERAYFEYEQSVRVAAEEALNAFSLLSQADKEDSLAQKRMELAHKKLNAQMLRKNAGFISELELQSSVLELLSEQQNQLQAKNNQAFAALSLYRAVGSGWSKEE